MSTLLTKITRIQGTGVPKPANDQNTDDIIPARFMKEVTFKNMGKYAYYDERFKEGKENPSHPFNQAKYKGGSILVAGANYGCGSSREHAPQALHRFGITAIIAESFAEIFAGNCASLGVVGVIIPANEITKLVETITAKPTTIITVDLEAKQVRYASSVVSFGMLEGRRQAFLNGTWDALTILQNDEKIKEVEKKLAYLQFK